VVDVPERAQRQIDDDRETVAQQTGEPAPPTTQHAPERPTTDTLDVAAAGSAAPRAAEDAARHADAEVRQELKEDLKEVFHKLTGKK
jgi:hypothetical protein